MRLARLARDEFIGDFWDYHPGEHVTLIEPTQGGKTHLGGQLLEAIRPQGIPAVMLVMKPRDRAPAMWTRRLGYREIPTWPPPGRLPWQEQPPGWTLWPRQGLKDVDADNLHVGTQFQKALLDVYRHGDQVVFADEVYGLIAELQARTPAGRTRNLATELTALWTRGSGMGAGLWAATQKPSGTQHGGAIPTFMYSASTHLFLGRDTDKRNTDRFGEIGGIDPAEVSRIVRALPVNHVQGGDGRTHYISDKLYIDKRGPYMCLIGP